MTRFETTLGTQLGARFLGDNGATFHLTEKEVMDLFNLDLDLEVVSDNSWFGTVKELMDMFVAGNKATDEEMMRRFNKTTTLHLEVRKGLDSNGEFQEFFVR